MVERNRIIQTMIVILCLSAGFGMAMGLQQFRGPASVPSVVMEAPQVEEKPLLPQQVVEQARAVETIHAEGDVTFVEVRTPYPAIETVYPSAGTNTELWRIDEKGLASVLHFMNVEPCTDFSWVVEHDAVAVTEMTSPCEAYMHLAQTVYSLEGTKIYQSDWSTNSGSFSFSTGSFSVRNPDVREFSIRLRNAPSCVGMSYEDDPQTTLLGVDVKKIRRGIELSSSFVPLPESAPVDCGRFYGEAVGDPTIGQPEFNGNTITFEVPGGYVGTFDLAAAEELAVTLTKTP